MELAAEEPGMVLELDDLDELSIGREAGHAESFLLERRNVLRIHFVAMTMALFDEIGSIRFARNRSFAQLTWILAQPHRAAKSVDADQIAELVDHLVRRFVIELRRVC